MKSSFRADARVSRTFTAAPLPGAKLAPAPDGTMAFRSAESVAPAPAPDPDPERDVRDAYERGLAAGQAELPFREAEALGTATDALEIAVRELRATRSGALEAQRDVVIELALAIASCVLERELRDGPDGLAPLVERALAEIAEPEAVALHLSESDHAALGEGGAPALERILERRDARLEVDARLRPGDVRIAFGAGEVDARRESVLARFRDELRALVPTEPEVTS